MKDNSGNQYKNECNSRPHNGCDNERSSEHDNERSSENNDECSSECSNKYGNECKSDCPDKEKCSLEEFRCKTHELNDIKRTVAVLSGKGGVGKSLVTSLLAVMMRRKGYQVGVLDADITGPSIPKVFGADDARAEVSEFGIYPVRTHNDIKIMSINLLLEKVTENLHPLFRNCYELLPNSNKKNTITI